MGSRQRQDVSREGEKEPDELEFSRGGFIFTLYVLSQTTEKRRVLRETRLSRQSERGERRRRGITDSESVREFKENEGVVGSGGQIRRGGSAKEEEQRQEQEGRRGRGRR